MLQKNVPLRKYSNYKIGGPASYFCEFSSRGELLDTLSEFEKIDPEGKVFVLGNGTNILFSDAGFDGLILKNNIKFITREKDLITVGSGTLIDELTTFCSQNSLSGLEWAGGLPGTVGGGIRGNAGAFLGEMGDRVHKVESLNLKNFKLKVRGREECNFGYRQSVFKNEGSDEVILSATFKLKKGDQEKIKKETQEKIDYRIDRHPLNLPNIGSTFKNVPVKDVSPEVRSEFEKSIKQDPFPVLPVAKLIIAAGLMGKQVGDAQFSTKHPNFIVNTGNAKAKEVLELVNLAKEEIKSKYDISLEEEIMVV